jgi:hypothetical protein
LPLTQTQLANAVADRADISRAEAKRVLTALEEKIVLEECTLLRVDSPNAEQEASETGLRGRRCSRSRSLESPICAPARRPPSERLQNSGRSLLALLLNRATAVQPRSLKDPPPDVLDGPLGRRAPPPDRVADAERSRDGRSDGLWEGPQWLARA